MAKLSTKICSAGMLETLATLPKLEALSMSEIPGDSMSVFLEKSSQPWFPALRHLYIGATAKTLEMVHQMVPDVEAIGVFTRILARLTIFSLFYLATGSLPKCWFGSARIVRYEIPSFYSLRTAARALKIFR